MKLHLTKSLRTALLACVCTTAALATQAFAAVDEDGDGKYTFEGNVTQGFWLKAGTTEFIVNGTDSYTLDGVNAYNNGYQDASYTKTGTGTLTVTGAASGTYNAVPVNVNVDEGTLVIQYSGDIANTAVNVNAGGLLQMVTNDDSRTDKFVLTGSASEKATMQIDNYQVIQGSITLGGYAEITGDNTYGVVLEGATVTATKTNNEISSIISVRKADATFNVTNSGDVLTITNAIKYNENGDKHAEDDTTAELKKTGDGTLVLSSTASLDKRVDLKVTEGTVELQKENFFAAGQKVTLAGADKDNVATLKLSANQTMTPVNITLEGHTCIEGTGTAIFSGSYLDNSYQGTKLTASGTNNTISANIAADWNINLEVQENGKLTLTGSVTQKNAGALVKTGTGTLALSSTATVANNVAIEHQAGILDLSDVTTLNASELYLASGSRLVLGSEALTFTGTLKVQDGAIIDISSWGTNVYDFYDVELFKGGTTLEFVASEDGTPGTGFVQIYFGGGDTVLWPNWLITHEDATGSVYAIPEPATATLSLLALAGLAARRRRK